MNRDQLYAMNIHYRYYDLEYFFRACQKMNLKHAELWLCPQHFYINSMWSESPEKFERSDEAVWRTDILYLSRTE